VAIALATGLSDHSDDYGQVPVPQGGVVHLPEGTATIYMSQLGNSDPIKQVTTPFNFQITPVGGGAPIPFSSTDGSQGPDAVQRSETIGELGAIAKLKVPSSGDYRVSASGDFAPGSTFLKFGTNSGAALLQRWKLLVGLVVGAFLIALIPTPRSRKRWEDDSGEPVGWSNDPRAPYAG
jgi:hypothetical protein